MGIGHDNLTRTIDQSINRLSSLNLIHPNSASELSSFNKSGYIKLPSSNRIPHRLCGKNISEGGAYDKWNRGKISLVNRQGLLDTCFIMEWPLLSICIKRILL